jgi:peptidoglycan hydrolase-like protein with peptidoglycan-binding domain
MGIGAKGAAVVELQELLIENRYDVATADGNFGGQTYHAVMAVQKAWGLPRTGRATREVLEQLRGGEQPAPIVSTGGPTRIEIDLPRQVLSLYIAGELRSILSISSGNNERFCEPDPEQGGKIVCDVARTPGGSFRVHSRILGYRESRLGRLYNPLYFNGGIAVHGSNSVPAGPASHGCVRVTNPSADWLFEAVPLGTPVYVYDGERVPRPLPDRAASTTSTSTTSTSTTSTSTTSTSSTSSSAVSAATSTTAAPTSAVTSTVAGDPAATTVPSTTTTAPVPATEPTPTTSTVAPATTSTLSPATTSTVPAALPSG